MALAFSSTIRTAQADAITTAAGNAALLRIYNGSRPASGGAVTTLLAELVCGTPFAAGAATGVLTLSAITQDSSADATGTASWFRIVKADGTTFVMDGNVSTSGSDLNLNSVSIVIGGIVSVTSAVITMGNP